MTLRYDISSLPAGTLKDLPTAGKGTLVFVKLALKPDGSYEAISVHREAVPIAAGEALIMGRATGGATCGSRRRSFCEQLDIRYGIERYFVPEGEGKAIEAARNQGKVAVVAAVTPDGRAAIRRLLLDGKQVYDEPMF